MHTLEISVVCKMEQAQLTHCFPVLYYSFFRKRRHGAKNSFIKKRDLSTLKLRNIISDKINPN